MKFNHEDYRSKNVVMHCETEEEYNLFSEYLDSIGKKWSSRSRYITSSRFSEYKENTCFYFNEGLYGNVERISEDDDITILRFKDFEWDGYSLSLDKLRDAEITFDSLFCDD